MKNSLWRSLKKNKKIEPPYDPTILFLGAQPKEMKSLCQRSKKYLYSQVYCNNMGSNQGVETTYMFVIGWTE